jgi:nitrogen fixation protein FixH
MTTHASNPVLSIPRIQPSAVARPRRLATARFWPWVPAFLLVSLIGTQLGVLSLVLDDPTFATEDDYYRKAVEWDARMARERQSRALGWTARASVASLAGGDATLSLELQSTRGPVSGAEVHGAAFPNARAGGPSELSFEESAPGVYRAKLSAPRAGQWELRLLARQGTDAYETTLRFEVVREKVTPEKKAP